MSFDLQNYNIFNKIKEFYKYISENISSYYYLVFYDKICKFVFLNSIYLLLIEEHSPILILSIDYSFI